MQHEARAACSNVAEYEDAEADDEDAAGPQPGLGSKLAYMYKRKLGAYSKVSHTATASLVRQTFDTNRPHYGSCPSVRPSVCPVWAAISRTKQHRKTEIGVNFPRAGDNRCANV